MPPTVTCQWRDSDGTTTSVVSLDVQMDVVPEVWLSASGEAPSASPHCSAFWRLGKWTVLTSGLGFDPPTIIGRALNSGLWDRDLPPEHRDEVLSLLRLIAAFRTC